MKIIYDSTTLGVQVEQKGVEKKIKIDVEKKASTFQGFGEDTCMSANKVKKGPSVQVAVFCTHLCNAIKLATPPLGS